jgi:hypothetical protein
MGKIHKQFLCQVSPTMLLNVFAGSFQIVLVDESGMIINQMGTQWIRSDLLARVTFCTHSTGIKDSTYISVI